MLDDGLAGYSGDQHTGDSRLVAVQWIICGALLMSNVAEWACIASVLFVDVEYVVKVSYSLSRW